MKPNLNPTTPRSLVRHTTVRKKSLFTQDMSKTENIKKNLVVTDSTRVVESERVPLRESIFFFVFVIAFFVIVSLQAPIASINTLTNQMNRGIFNWLRLSDGYHAANGSKILLEDVANLDDVMDFITQSLEDQLTTANSSIFYDHQSFDNFYFLKPITSWRIVQTRVEKVTGKNPLSPYRWDPGMKESHEAFGKNGRFTYSEDENGFPVYIDMAYNETAENAPTTFQAIMDDSYFDSYSKSLKFDMGYYSGPYQLVCYCGANFELSPTGAASAVSKTGCTRSKLYVNSSDYVRGALEGLFVLITIQYMYIEVKKLLYSVKSEKQKLAVHRKKPQGSKHGGRLSVSNVKDSAFSAINQGADNISGLINGILKHIQNLWTFLDLASIILCMLAIIYWAQYAFNGELLETLESLEVKDTRYVITNQDQMNTMHSLNRIIEARIDRVENYYRICALNGVLIMVKIIKYLATVSSSVREILTLMIRMAAKVFSFLVLLITLMLAFAACMYYYLGSRIKFFSSFGNTFFYTVANIMRNFSQLDKSMLNTDYTFSYFVFMIYTFVIIFIMVNMFLIYVVVEYRKYAAEMKKEQENKEKRPQQSQVHPVSEFINFFKDKLYMRFLILFRKTKYDKLRRQEMTIAKEMQREAITLEAFNYDINIQDTILQSERKHENYANDVIKERLHIKKVKNMVKLFWTTTGVAILLIFVLVLTIQRHIIEDVYAMSSNLREQFYSVQLSPTFKEKETPNLDHLLNFNDLKNYFVQDMPNTHTLRYYILTAASGQEGVPLYAAVTGNYNLIPSPQLMFTIRKKRIQANDDSPLNNFLNITIPSTFAADDPVDEGKEIIHTLSNAYGNKSYEYNHNAPGYQVVMNLLSYDTEIQTLFEDGLIDSSVNSIVIEAPVYHAIRKLPIYLKMTFYLDSAGSVSYNLEFRAIKTLAIANTPSSDEIFFYVAELIFGIIFIWYGVHTIRKIKRKADVYNHWYQLYVVDFPELFKRKRFLRKPEFIRRLEYIFDSGEIINVIYAVLLIVSTIMDGIFFGVALKLRYYYNNVVLAVRTDTPDTLSYTIGDILAQLKVAISVSWWLRFLNSLTILAICIKIIFYYSYNSHFFIITETLKKSGRMSPFLAFCLLLVVFAFAYLVMFILGPNDSGYADIISAWRSNFGLLFGLSNVDMSLITNYRDSFLIFVFFFPFVVINKFILSNLFIGAIYNSYTETKMEVRNRPKEPFVLSEWAKVTLDMITRKKQVEVKAAIEITNEFAQSVDADKVIASIR